MNEASIEDRIHRFWLEANPELNPESLHGRSWIEFLIKIRKQEQNQDRIPDEIDNNIIVLDECIAFFGCLQFAYLQDLKSGVNTYKYEQRAFGLVSGAIAHYLFCIRTLSERGLDVGAKALSRVASEYIELLSVLVQADLAEAFCGAQAPDEANRFWHQNLSKGKTSKVSKKLWAAAGVGEKEIRAMEEWSREENLVLSASAHPSLLAAYMASTSGSWGQKNVLGAYLGGFDSAQFRTIRYIATKIFVFFALNHDFPFALTRGSLAGEGIMHDYVRHGLRVVPQACALLIADPNDKRFHRPDERFAEGEL